MQRDMDLYREILFQAEASEPTEYVGAKDMDVEDHSDAEVYAHIRLLADEGLVEIVGMATFDHPNACRIERITALGHDFLEETRDDDRWSRLKREAKEMGPLTLSAIQTAINLI